jgi:hypothetical protein
MSEAMAVMPSSLGFIKIQFTDAELLPVRQEIEKIKLDFEHSTKWNTHLAGNLEQEYKLTDCAGHLDSIFQPQIEYFRKSFYDLPKVELVDPWVNFQKKHEFNPMHMHDGLLSFVIWTHVPYSIEDEMQQKRSKDSNRPVAGCFAFQYANIFGEPSDYVIPADKNMQNYALLFPANLKHAVYPFYTSDEYRISVSGNFHIA